MGDVRDNIIGIGSAIAEKISHAKNPISIAFGIASAALLGGLLMVGIGASGAIMLGSLALAGAVAGFAMSKGMAGKNRALATVVGGAVGVASPLIAQLISAAVFSMGLLAFVGVSAYGVARFGVGVANAVTGRQARPAQPNP